MKKTCLLPYKFIVLVLFLILSSCSNKNITISEIKDPFENINRKIFNFNQSVDEKVISPISASYEKITPPSARKAIRNHIDWLYNKIINLDINYKELVKLSEEIYEKGLSSLDLLDCIKNKLIFNKKLSRKIKLTNELISKVCICFDTIKKEYRCEKLLMLYLLDYLFLRSNKDLKSITEI